jgi:hypothetical protein
MNATSTDAAIADTIWQQIGSDTRLAISARSFTYGNTNGDTFLKFRFGSNHGLANYCDITYRPGTDDYTLHAYKIRRNLAITTTYLYERVDADSLPFFLRQINDELFYY